MASFSKGFNQSFGSSYAASADKFNREAELKLKAKLDDEADVKKTQREMEAQASKNKAILKARGKEALFDELPEELFSTLSPDELDAETKRYEARKKLEALSGASKATVGDMVVDTAGISNVAEGGSTFGNLDAGSTSPVSVIPKKEATQLSEADQRQMKILQYAAEKGMSQSEAEIDYDARQTESLRAKNDFIEEQSRALLGDMTDTEAREILGKYGSGTPEVTNLFSALYNLLPGRQTAGEATVSDMRLVKRVRKAQEANTLSSQEANTLSSEKLGSILREEGATDQNIKALAKMLNMKTSELIQKAGLSPDEIKKTEEQDVTFFGMGRMEDQ